jgi:TetR/AcrR family transcriptional regulator, transcriptional repressor for nem operon
MPKPLLHTAATIAADALPVFWRRGYDATSIDDVVRSTGVSRHALYQAFRDKQALFLACLDHYRESIVTPAFGPIEAPGANFRDVAQYFETQIALAERGGLPGPGCLFVNTMKELAMHDEAIAALVRAHDERMRRGYAKLLRTLSGNQLGRRSISDRAAVLTVATHGLWSVSRTTSDAKSLRRIAHSILKLILPEPRA